MCIHTCMQYLISHTHTHTPTGVDLERMLARLGKLGYDTDADSFSFDEVVHRSAKRYDLKLDRCCVYACIYVYTHMHRDSHTLS